MNENNSTHHLIDLLTPLVAPLGYEIVHLEIVSSRQKLLRIFIDRAESSAELGAVGIEDCVKVTRALDEPLDQLPEVDKLFHGGQYELEVSSPGVDRPLRTPRDFERFAGREIRIHVYRPLTAEELSNADYQTKNPKQKNFLGKLVGFRNERVLLDVSSPSGESGGKKGQKSKTKRASESGASPTETQKAGVSKTNSAAEVSIPLPLIAKANLEPKFEPEFAKAERE